MKIFLYILIITNSFDSAFATAAKTTLKQMRDKYASKPKSCEFIYYSLFIDEKGVKKTFFDGDGKNILVNLSKEQFSEACNCAMAPTGAVEAEEKAQSKIQESITAPALFQSISEYLRSNYQHQIIDKYLGEQKEIADKHVFEINRVNFKISSNNSSADSKAEVYTLLPYDQKVHPSIVVDQYWNVTHQSAATQVFWLGHELTHLTDYVDNQTAQCLSDHYGTNKPKYSESVSRDLNQLFGVLHEKYDFLAAKVLERTDRSRTVMTQRWLNSLDDIWPMLIQKPELLNRIGHENYKSILELAQVRVDYILQALKRKPSSAEDNIDTQNKAELDRMLKELVSKLKTLESNNSGGGFGTGMGTNAVTKLESYYSNGKTIEAKKYFEELQLYSMLPEQKMEAIADIRGIELAANYIKTHYKDSKERRDAALAILFSLPPHLYNDDARLIMDSISSKKTNETRALKLLLSNKDFRKIIGCDFAFGTEPKSCAQNP